MNDLFDLRGRIALVTGGYRGIGRMIAEEFVERGVRTYITGRNADGVMKAAEELSAKGECIGIPNDLGTIEGVTELAEAIASRESQLDILINNAGTGWHAPLDEFPEKGWDKTFNLNIKAPFFLTQKLRPLLAKAGSLDRPAKVINISSTDSLYVPTDESYPYLASKAGLNHLTRKLANRLAKDHIRVNTIAPGAFESEMNVAAVEHPDLIAAFVPAGRVGRPSDIAGTCVYMVSSAGDYLVGVVLPVDGGATQALPVVPMHQNED